MSEGHSDNSVLDEQASRWKQVPDRGSPWLIRLMIKLVQLFGRRVGLLLLYPITFYFILTSDTRQASRRYLTRALGRQPRFSDQFRHYYSFAVMLLDRVFLLSDQVDRFELEIEGGEHIMALTGQQQGALLLGSHHGSFDVLRALALAHPQVEVKALMYQGNAQAIVKLFNAINPALAKAVIPIGDIDSMFKVQEAIDEGDLVGVLGDRADGGQKLAQYPFLDKPAPFPKGPFQMAVALKVPVVMFWGLYLGGNRYRIVFEPLTEGGPVKRSERSQTIDGWMQQYVNRLEYHCRQAPYNWFNFFDFWQELSPTDATAERNNSEHDNTERDNTERHQA